MKETKKRSIILIIIVAIISCKLFLSGIRFIKISILEKRQVEVFKENVKNHLAEYNLEVKGFNIAMKNKREDPILGHCSHIYMDTEVDSSFQDLDEQEKKEIVCMYELIHNDYDKGIYKKGIDIDVGTMALICDGEKYYAHMYEENTQNEESNYTSTIDEESNEVAYTLTANDEEKAFAWTAAIAEVKKRLKSPSTAKFPFSYYGQEINKATGNKFQVISYVDAENGFGAKIRTTFIVEIEKIDDETYNVIDVLINE